MKICEVTDKNKFWERWADKNAIIKVTELDAEIKRLEKLLGTLYSTTLIKNLNLPGKSEIENAVKSLTKELNDYPDQSDVDVIAANSKISDIQRILSKYK